MSELFEALEHVDRLNSWVRSESFREQWFGAGAIRRIVYRCKTDAIMAAAAAELTTHYRVVDLVTCRDCGGDGKYIDSMGYQHDHCWRCQNKGTLALHFLRTRIDGDRYVWHTPREGAWSIMSWEAFAALPRVVDVDWHVNQPGKDLPLDEAVASMMAIEERFERPPWRTAIGYAEDVTKYKLHIGRTDPDRCVICGATEGLYTGNISTHQGRLCWSSKVCRRCHDANPGGAIFEACAAIGPGDLVTPTIAEWVEKHPVPDKQRRYA